MAIDEVVAPKTEYVARKIHISLNKYAMIIEKIELQNFMCYSGKNTIEFNEGINVVIGDNGYGKSKLYDAFYWVMYDQVFATEQKSFQTTKSKK